MGPTFYKDYKYYLSYEIDHYIMIFISSIDLSFISLLNISNNLNNLNNLNDLNDLNYLNTNGLNIQLQEQIGCISKLRNSPYSELRITAQLYSNGFPMHKMVQSTKCPSKISNNIITWNQWITFPIKYSDIPRNAKIGITIRTVGDIPMGGTTLNIFKDNIKLKDGLQRLIIYKDIEADGSIDSLTQGDILDNNINDKNLFFQDDRMIDNSLSNLNQINNQLDNQDNIYFEREMYRLDKLSEKYDRKKSNSRDSSSNLETKWLDHITQQRISQLRQSMEISNTNMNCSIDIVTSPRDFCILNVSLPYFGYPVLYEEESYVPRHSVAYSNNNSKSNHSLTSFDSPTTTNLNGEVKNTSHFNETDSMNVEPPELILVWDPDIEEVNPVEQKYRKLARDIFRKSTIDPNLKPNREEKILLDKIINNISAHDSFLSITDTIATKHNATALNEEKDLLWKFRYTLLDNKKALTKFLCAVDWNDETEVMIAINDFLPKWCEIDMVDALKLLSGINEYKHHAVRTFAVNTLAKATDDELLDYLLQLVQALRYEKNMDQGNNLKNSNHVIEIGPLAKFLISRACNSFHLANFFYWYLKVELNDVKDGSMYRAIFDEMIKQMKKGLDKNPINIEYSNAILETLLVQDYYMSELSECHAKARDEKGKKDYKEERFKELLKSNSTNLWQKNKKIIRLPLDPSIQLSNIIPASGKLFKSAMYPALIEFQTVSIQLSDEKKENLNVESNLNVSERKIRETRMLKESLSFHNETNSNPLSIMAATSLAARVTQQVLGHNNSNLSTTLHSGPTYKVMFKIGDDLRQDQLIMQMFQLMDSLLKKVNLDLRLTPYRILATSTSDGMMEFVLDSFPVSYIVSHYEVPQVLNFMKKHHPNPHADYGVSSEALSNYVKSVAGYCVLTYLLGIGDRHLDNLMMKTEGHLFHIDFGCIFGRDPKPYPPPFKLTKEMVEGMGGVDSVHYSKFKTYACQAYNWLRKSASLILNLLSLMVDAGIQDLSTDPVTTLAKVQEKFRLDLTDEQAEQFFLGLINDSVTALFPVLMEYIHKVATKLR